LPAIISFLVKRRAEGAQLILGVEEAVGVTPEEASIVDVGVRTMQFDVHDEKALHEFVRKHADPEEWSTMEKHDASHAEAGEPVDHIYSDIEWIVENGHAYDAEGIEHTGGETGDSYEEDEEDTE
jgi:hypothetical protein